MLQKRHMHRSRIHSKREMYATRISLSDIGRFVKISPLCYKTIIILYYLLIYQHYPNAITDRPAMYAACNEMQCASVDNLSYRLTDSILRRTFLQFPHINIQNIAAETHIASCLASGIDIIDLLHVVGQRGKDEYELDNFSSLLTDEEARVDREMLDFTQFIAVAAVAVA